VPWESVHQDVWLYGTFSSTQLAARAITSSRVILPSLSVPEGGLTASLQGGVGLEDPPEGFGSGVVGCWPGVPGPDGADDPGGAGPPGFGGVDGDGGHGPVLGAGLVVGVGVVVGVVVVAPVGLPVGDSVELGGCVVVGSTGGVAAVSVELGGVAGDPAGEPGGDPVGAVVGGDGAVDPGQDGSPGLASLVGAFGFRVRVGRSNAIASPAMAPVSVREAPVPADNVPSFASAVEAVVPNATQPTADSTNRLPRRSLACRLFRATSPAP
jgi:hypothetical protein